MEYPGTRRVATLDFITHVLDHVVTQGHNFKAARAEGGEGFIRWSNKVLWNRFQNEVLYAKIYLEKRKIFAAEIEALRAREQAIIMTLAVLRLAVQKLNTAGRDAAEEIRSLLDELGEVEETSRSNVFTAHEFMCFKVFLFMTKETFMSAKIILPLSESKGL